MKVILTHEQSDLDALASLLAAHLLNGDAYAALPRKINRNGSKFIRAYKQELGFTPVDQLPNEPITDLTLVDTQSMVTLKGLSSRTRIHVIDHHPEKTQLNPNWQLELHTTGACTTILVEKIQKTNPTLTVGQATLLLLGIYEDTGSLSYTNTTPRDLMAAAYLIEKGADLDLIPRYMYNPLTHAQVLLYDRLLKDVTHHKVGDFNILIARANAMDLQDEISTIAHKMRDFLNPDALILLVSTKQGIRLIARSTTDELDMGQLARYFNGGGHKRAASALIRSGIKAGANDIPGQWKQIYQRVVSLLPEIVHPLNRVRQIMSVKPLVLDPDTPVETVADIMKRYGFEGYPVLENGEIVGLVTRRNVDRALSHKIPANAGSLMDAGHVSVAPQDSLDYVRDVMSESGWGQIPVVDPETGEVIGIVTRTDLISVHANGNHAPSQDEMVRMLHNAIPYPRQVLLQTIAREATTQHVQAYIVGGFVRDLLLKKPSLDFDIVIEGNAIDFVHHLVKTYGGTCRTHSRFGTAKWVFGDDRQSVADSLLPDHPIDPLALPEHLDLITARTEFYEKPAALPTVESSSIKMDLHRRDFSINTMALRLDGDHYGRLFDYWGGFQDLKNGLIRVLHALSFVDDATRILRAVRFATRFNFKIESRTIGLLAASLPLLQELSGPRLRHELDLILQEDQIVDAVRSMHRLSILEAIHPALQLEPAVLDRLAYLNQPAALAEWKMDVRSLHLTQRQVLGYCYWLEGLNDEDLMAVSARLRLPTTLETSIAQVRQLRMLLPELLSAPPSVIVSGLADLTPAAITAVYQSTPDQVQREILHAYMTRYHLVKPIVNGHDLRERGLPPSPRYQTVLSALRAGWLDGKITSAEEELAFLDQLLSQS